MRLNVYSEELTPYVEMVTKTADTGVTFYGIRVFVEGSPALHRPSDESDDNDESAITFWARADDGVALSLLDALFSRGLAFVQEAVRQWKDEETPSPKRTVDLQLGSST